ncbi:MAG TPA: protein-glutamate O-methyltransferase CheR [Candidatus Tectomicrobia bacterium]
MRPSTLLACELLPEQFTQISQLIYRLCGISMRPGKEGLVKARLMKRLMALGLESFADYLAYVEGDTSGRELITMIDVLTTNKTSFFRESQHFTYLRQHMVPQWRQDRHPIRFWSAGCSSGEEPYSLAMVLREELPEMEQRDIRILATDISTSVLATARQAVYTQETLSDVPAPLFRKYFTLVRREPTPAYQVNETIRGMVRLARLNLMHKWPMRGPFDAIFCRNVMIYFDKPTQEWLVQRFCALLRPGGYLFIGHAESLPTALQNLRYVQPALYVRPPGSDTTRNEL